MLDCCGLLTPQIEISGGKIRDSNHLKFISQIRKFESGDLSIQIQKTAQGNMIPAFILI